MRRRSGFWLYLKSLKMLMQYAQDYSSIIKCFSDITTNNVGSLWTKCFYTIMHFTTIPHRTQACVIQLICLRQFVGLSPCHNVLIPISSPRWERFIYFSLTARKINTVENVCRLHLSMMEPPEARIYFQQSRQEYSFGQS